MTQPLLFAELEFNAANLIAWAKSVIAEVPTVTVYEYATESRAGGYVDVPNTVEYVLRSVLEAYYYAINRDQKASDLTEELVNYLINGVPGKLPCDMNADELAATIIGEVDGSFDFASMEEFLDSPLAGAWGEDDEEE